jgi:uncharacterized protein YrzB (UPF0473 family)
MAFLKKKTQVINKKVNVFTPTQNRILTMDREFLIKHYALVRCKQSSMGAEERRILLNRIEYGVSKKTITVEELQIEVDKVQDMIQEVLNENSNNPF